MDMSTGLGVYKSFPAEFSFDIQFLSRCLRTRVSHMMMTVVKCSPLIAEAVVCECGGAL